ncbi:hypothetical protein LDENG_00259850 [Lucifuga dentata]|nr:hypothetical protein LDENG_00259850 [Lucifuga dentata]
MSPAGLSGPLIRACCLSLSPGSKLKVTKLLQSGPQTLELSTFKLKIFGLSGLIQKAAEDSSLLCFVSVCILFLAVALLFILGLF